MDSNRSNNIGYYGIRMERICFGSL